jgi:hypothetical protein
VTEIHAVGRVGGPGRTPDFASGLIILSSLALCATVVVGRGVAPAAAMLAVVSAFAAWHRSILAWPVLICLAVASVLFVPVGRYSLAIPLPLGIDLWQLAVFAVVVVWLGALLVDPTVQLRRTPLDGPIALIVAASLCSVAVNYGRVAPLASTVLKGLIVFVSFIALFYFVSSVISTRARLVAVTKFIVAGASFVAFFSIIEQRTGFNLFDHIQTVVPVLEFKGSQPFLRDGLLRAFGSSDHPIALGVLFSMTFPLAFAFAKSGSRVWWVPTLVILIGVMATASRTAVMAMVAVGLVFLWLRRSDVVPLLPLLIPLLIIVKVAAPGSIATIKNSFLPGSGQSLLQEQQALAADPTLISGRANFKPKLVEGMHRPILGQGLGTRQTGADNPLRNAPILDNQWLGTFLDIGLVGVAGWLWLFGRTGRLLGRVARTRGSPDGLLAAGFVASITSFGVSMLTYDALAFLQETLVLWVLLALAGALIRTHAEVSSRGLEA